MRLYGHLNAKKHRIKLVSDEFLGDPPLILMANYTKIKIDKW